MTSPLPEEVEEALANLHAEGGDRAALERLCLQYPQFAKLLRVTYEQLARLDSEPLARPEKIGPYRILKELGHGGMGVVYLAEQESPVRQVVAVKLLKSAGDKQLMRRFDQERQALALMNHDGIAKVYRCDTTEEGYPYIAMEFVRGVPLTTYCDEHRLAVRERLHLMQQVCAAITHAHQKGIVHRDLKPDNILVSEEGGTPRVKIIDFGLAKSIGMRLSAAPDHTEFGQIVGTLQYMAPEQAGVSNADVDTRADIYSIGVILHELLVGWPPVTREELARAGYDGMQRLLRDRSAQPPSTRIKMLGDPHGIAAQRRATASGLRHAMQGDLDWAVLKAIEPDPSRRYETASALASDLQRHLDHEPLFAGPPSSWYRLSKLLRRYRAQFAAVGAVLLTAVVGAFVALAQAQEAHDQRLVAEQNLAARKQQILLGEAAQLQRMADADLWWNSVDGPSVAALDAWLLRAESLREEVQVKGAELAALRRTALPQTTAEVHALQASFERWGELSELQRSRDAIVANLGKLEVGERAKAAKPLPAIELDIAQLERELEHRRVWRFADAAQQARHDELAHLLGALVPFLSDAEKDLVPSVRRRREIAQTLDATRSEVAVAWFACTAAASGDEAAVLRRLATMPGLLPIGRDPKSGRLEFCLLTTGTAPTRAADGQLQWTPECGLVLVLLPAATLWMGSQSSDEAGRNFDRTSEVDEQPMHEVPLESFLVGKHEVHQAAWQRMTGEVPSLVAPDRYGLNVGHPVEQVSWQQCVVVLRRYGLCLPTEARWEYAARGGTSKRFWMPEDDEVMAVSMNVADLTVLGQEPWDPLEPWRDGFVLHAPVASFAANPFGLHHVLGNVWEWCLDEYAGEAAYTAPTREGDGLRLVAGLTRSVRGGTFAFPRSTSRCSNRGTFAPATLAFDIGVRVAMDVPR